MTTMIAEQEAGFDLTAGYQFWRNPVDNVVYATINEPTNGFNEDRDAYPVFDLNQRESNITKIKNASQNGLEFSSLGLQTPYIDAEFYEKYQDWKSEYMAGGRQKMAALLSPTNTAVNILNVFPRVYGKKDRKYAGRELAQEVAVPNLELSVDFLAKYSGMAEIGELQMPFAKEIRYNRTLIQAKKYGLVFEISEESMLKNLHNPLQDSIEVANTKLDQRVAFDVITEFTTNVTAVAALGAWDTFVAGTDRSTTNPYKDVTRIVTSTIEATGIGGTLSRIGMHQNTKVDYDANSFLRGIVEPAPEPDWDPKLMPIKGFAGTALVQDQFIPQGQVFLADVGDESTMLLVQGPTRVASKRDEFTASERYGIFDFHVAQVINQNTGRRITGATTPIAPA